MLSFIPNSSLQYQYDNKQTGFYDENENKVHFLGLKGLDLPLVLKKYFELAKKFYAALLRRWIGTGWMGT